MPKKSPNLLRLGLKFKLWMGLHEAYVYFKFPQLDIGN